MTFGALQTKVADYLNKDNLTSIIPDFINSAMHRVEKDFNWKTMRKKATGSTTDDYVAIPTRYKEMDCFFITESGVKNPLTKTEYSHLITIFPHGNGFTGMPEAFATVEADSKFYMRPWPDAVKTYEIVYYAYTADMSLTTDNNDWTNNAWEVLLYGSLLEASPYLIADDRLLVWKGFYDEAINKLQLSERREKFRGSPQSLTSPYTV